MNLRRAGFVALEVVLVAAVPVLGWVGFRTVLDTTEGQAVDPELDPNEPGYEAFLEPTPLALPQGLDDGGDLSWLTVVGLGGPQEQGGSVLFIPVATLTEDGRETLAEVRAEDGERALAAAVGELLDAGFADVVTVAPGRVADLVAPVAPIELRLADDVEGFDTGDVALDPDEVAALLLARDEAESDLNRLARQEAVWRAWLGAIAASSDPGAVPGETGSGLGRYVRGLSLGAVAYDTAPVEVVDAEATDEEGEVFEADVEALRALVADRIPFPVADRPGGRVRVRVLDAVGVEGLSLLVARDAVRAGGQVTVIGNADAFGRETSRVTFFDGAVAADAAAVAAALGIGSVEQLPGPNPDDLVDVTVVVGSDLAAAYR